MDARPERLSRKTTGLSGSLLAEYVRCGKFTCRCMNGGQQHGPYWRRFWREDGRTRSAYVRRNKVEAVRRAITQWHHTHPSLRSLHRDLRALGDLGKEAGLW
jgi:hypothetical protein